MTERSEHDTVAFEVADRIAWVKFNRPEKRNCMSPKLNRRMMEVLDELEFRDDVGVLVLTGEGTAWSAGMDLKEYFRETEAQGLRRHAQGAARELWLVAAAALVSEADHRDGQRLVLRRRLRPAVRLRPGLRRRGGAVRPVARSTGASCPAAAPPRSRCELMSVPQRHVPRADGRERSTASTAAEWGWSTRRCRWPAARPRDRGGATCCCRRTRSRSRRPRTPSAASAR